MHFYVEQIKNVSISTCVYIFERIGIIMQIFSTMPWRKFEISTDSPVSRQQLIFFSNNKNI